MTNYRKILYPLTALLLAIVLAACAGTRELERVEIRGEDGDSVNLVMSVDAEQQLTLLAHFDNGTSDMITNPFINWESSNEDIPISTTGVVSPDAAGITTITATHSPATDSEFSDTVVITVSPL